MEKNIDYVTCPICQTNLKEINTAHLKKHGIKIQEFDKKYPNNPRLSKSVLESKSHFKNMTKELSAKLKKSHTIEGYIEKYGEVEGKNRFFLMKQRKKNAHTLNGFIERYGKIDGRKKWDQYNKSKGVTEDGLIKKYGKIEGAKKYLNWKYSNNLSHYIKKYGEEEGLRIWRDKYTKHSKKMRRIPEDQIDFYIKYRYNVNSYTNLSLAKYNLPNIEKRGEIYQLDHKYSICRGFLKKIDPIIIGSIYNLEIIPSLENNSKQDKCSIEIKDLFESVYNDKFYVNLLNEEKYEN